ncbi:hypothetical protein pb186bvf_016239 [Paramecium bursaria]
MSIPRQCQVQKHHESLVTHICLFKDCQNNFRWACEDCLRQNLHQHRQQNNNHLMDRQQLIELLQVQTNSFNLLISQINQDFLTLTRQQINRIIDFHSQSNKQQNKQNDENDQQLLEQSELNYALYYEQEIDGKLHFLANCPNEKFLIFSVGTQIFQFDSNAKQLILSKQLRHGMNICSFSKDSKYFLCGSYQGWLFCFKFNQNFKLIYRFKMVPFFQDQIILIEPCLMITLSGCRQKLLILKQKNNSEQQAFEYNTKSQILVYVYDVGVNQNNQFMIKFIKIPSLQLIILSEFKSSKAIQMLSDDRLISIQYCTDENLYLWKIDYDQKQVTLLKTFNSSMGIISFQYFNSIQKIFVYSRNDIQVISSDLKIEQNMNHQMNCAIHANYRNKQKSQNYIVLIGGNLLRILKFNPA